MYQKVLSFCQQNSMIKENDKIIVGISGGADSVCLLELLCLIQEIIPIHLYAVHVNHKMREEAGADAEFVEKLCRSKQIPFFLKEIDIPSIVMREGISSEEAGRNARYRIFEELRIQLGADKVAVAHHKNDQAETVLFHLLRGCGLKGLGGIRPVRGRIIRPLLCLEREEIERYIKENKVEIRIDHTNSEDDYTRNRIRNYLLPIAKDMVSPRAIEHIVEAAEIASEAEEYLYKITKEAYELTGKETKAENRLIKIELNQEKYRKLDKIIQKYLLRFCYEKVAGSLKDLTAVHIESIFSMMEKQVGKRICLPNEILVSKTYSGLLFELDPKKLITKKQPDLVKIELNKEMNLSESQTIKTCIFEKKNEEMIPSNLYTKWFDYDKIEQPLILRNRCKGDYLIINEDGGRKSIKQYMIDEKIPKENRDQILLLADGSHVLWVVGKRISYYYKVQESTKKIIEVKITGGCELWQSM